MALLTLGAVAPERVPLWVNASNAVLVPSEREGFGLAVLEALACDVPVLATPVGVHPEALRRRRGHAVRAVRARRAGGTRSSPTCAPPTRACRDAPAPSRSRRGAWPSASRRPGARPWTRAG